MAKGTGGHYKHPSHARWTTVHVPKDADLAQALRGSGGLYEDKLNAMSAAADPSSGMGSAVTLPAGEVGAILEDLADLLGRARDRNHPSAGMLAQLAAQLGYREPAPERAPAPAPEAAPAPVRGPTLA
jgi:hypothetical protein